MDPEQEIDLLKSLVSSAPWELFARESQKQYSDTAVLQRVQAQIDRTMAGDEMSQHESVRSALAAQKAVLAMLAWPEARLRELGGKHAPKGQQTIVERFFAQVGRP